jgi:hypothetical protein
VEPISSSEVSAILQERVASQLRELPSHRLWYSAHICREMVRGASHFEEIEIWGKREIRKDPIAVGIAGNGERYLICRWGMAS